LKPEGGDKMKEKRQPYHEFKQFLKENKIRQHELADLLHLSRTNLNLKLNGKGADFSLDEIRMIKKLYGISSDDFFCEPGINNETKEVSEK
jgi:predicted XRE-type DNA-binding protein